MMLEVRNLIVTYGDIPALEDVSFDVKAGEIVGLIGPNGAGKTSVIRAMSGVTPVQSGSILIDEKDIRKCTPAERARMMAVVPQARQMGGAYTVRQAVMMGRTAYMGWLGRENEQDVQYVERALEQTNLLELAERQIAQLSGGEQQRVLLARALAQSAPVMLLDEPTNHLDLRHQTEFLQLMRTLAREKGLAVVVAMHDLNLAAIASDRVILLAQGRIFATGTPEDVLVEQNLEQAYQIKVKTMTDPESGKKFILPHILD